MTRIHFIFPTNRRQLAKEVKLQKSPDNALYGYNHLTQRYSVDFQDIPRFLERILDLLFLPVHLLFISQLDVDFKVPRILLQLPRINKSEVVLANTDGVGLALCFLKKLKLIRPKIIYAVGLFYIQGGLEKSLRNKEITMFGKFYKWIISGADNILYHSPIEKEKLQALGVYDPAKCTFMTMGSDNKFFKNKDKEIDEDDFILSVGKDRARDYETLFKAADMLPQYEFVVICRERNIKGLNVPANVQTIFEAPYREVARWYRRSKLLIIPIREMHRSSGQMTLTDGMQCAKTIIISEVVGVSHYNLQDKKEIFFVAPEDTQAMSSAIKLLMSNKKLRSILQKGIKKVARLYTTKEYSRNISKVVERILGPFELVVLTEEDLEFIRNLRNRNRTFFLRSSYITKSGHEKWYKKAAKGGNEFNYVVKRGKENIGFGSIYDIDRAKRTAEIGRLMIKEKFRNLTYGQSVLRLLEEIAFGELKLTKLKLAVLKDNKAAYHLYKKDGYHTVKELTIGGKKAVIMAKNKSGDNV